METGFNFWHWVKSKGERIHLVYLACLSLSKLSYHSLSLIKPRAVSCSVVLPLTSYFHVLFWNLIAEPEVLPTHCTMFTIPLYITLSYKPLGVVHGSFHSVNIFFTWALLGMMDQPFSNLCPDSFISLYLRDFNLHTFISRSASHHAHCPC